MTEPKDFEKRVVEIVEGLKDSTGDEGMYPFIVGIELDTVFEESKNITLLTNWDAMSFECLQHLSKVFGTKNINFRGQQGTTYPYSEYTPIPVHTGTLYINDITFGDVDEKA